MLHKGCQNLIIVFDFIRILIQKVQKPFNSVWFHIDIDLIQFTIWFDRKPFQQSRVQNLLQLWNW